MHVEIVNFPKTRVAAIEHRGSPALEHDTVRSAPTDVDGYRFFAIALVTVAMIVTDGFRSRFQG